MRSAIARFMLAILALVPMVFAQTNDAALKAMRDEMKRSKEQLRLPDMEKPYYIEYRVDDASVTTIEASLGALTENDANRTRTLAVHLRAGDFAFDNTNFVSTRTIGSRLAALGGQTRTLPLDDDYDLIRREIWRATDRAYKQAIGEFAAKKSVLQTRKYSVNLPDFTPQAPVSNIEPFTPVKVDNAALQTLARDLSAVFRSEPDIIDSEVSIVIRNLYKRFCNSEGTLYTRSEPVIALHVRGRTRAADGFPIDDSFSVFTRNPNTLRSADLMPRVKSFAAKLVSFRKATTLERYNGPVLFEGEAAGQVLSDVFAPAIAAARFPLSDEPQFETAMTQMFGQMGGTPLADKLGGRVMPNFIDVVDKPRLQSIAGIELLGTRGIDDEGVPTRDVNVVESGVLKNLLATRTPTVAAKTSTGSKGPFGAVASNLILTAKKLETAAELRRHLLELAKERGYDYGIVIRHGSEGALSWVARFASTVGAQNAANSVTFEVYKVFADGHEQRVRGIEITSLTPNSFKDVVAAGDTPSVYNSQPVPTMNAIFSGFGGVGMTADILALGSFVSPALLFEEVSLKTADVPLPNPPVVPSPLPAFTQNTK